MKHVVKHLDKILKDVDRASLAKQLSLNAKDWDEIQKGEQHILPELAIQMCTLVNADPLELLTAQTEDTLALLGSTKKPREKKVVDPKPARGCTTMRLPT